jgi:hypothetical protein
MLVNFLDDFFFFLFLYELGWEYFNVDPTRKALVCAEVMQTRHFFELWRKVFTWLDNLVFL